jgi:GTPase KRas protein
VCPQSFRIAYWNVFGTPSSEKYDPTIEDTCCTKQVEIDGEICLLDILDSAGQEEYAAMRDGYIRYRQGFLLAYSITSRISFDEISAFQEQIKRVHDSETVPMVLVATKSDLEANREVSTIEGEALANTWGIRFFETSALARTNVDESFFETVRAIQIQRSRSPTAEAPNKTRKDKCRIL